MVAKIQVGDVVKIGETQYYERVGELGQVTYVTNYQSGGNHVVWICLVRFLDTEKEECFRVDEIDAVYRLVEVESVEDKIN